MAGEDKEKRRPVKENILTYTVVTLKMRASEEKLASGQKREEGWEGGTRSKAD